MIIMQIITLTNTLKHCAEEKTVVCHKITKATRGARTHQISSQSKELDSQGAAKLLVNITFLLKHTGREGGGNSFSGQPQMITLLLCSVRGQLVLRGACYPRTGCPREMCGPWISCPGGVFLRPHIQGDIRSYVGPHKSRESI